MQPFHTRIFAIFPFWANHFAGLAGKRVVPVATRPAFLENMRLCGEMTGKTEVKLEGFGTAVLSVWLHLNIENSTLKARALSGETLH